MRTPPPDLRTGATSPLGTLDSIRHQACALFDAEEKVLLFATEDFLRWLENSGALSPGGKPTAEAPDCLKKAWSWAWARATSGHTTCIDLPPAEASGPYPRKRLRFEHVDSRGRPLVAVVLHSDTTGAAVTDATRQAPLHRGSGAGRVGVIRWDADGRVRHWSPGAESLFGWSESTVLGTNLLGLGLLSPSDVPRLGHCLRGVVDKPDSSEAWTTRCRTRDGRLIACRWHVTGDPDTGGAAFVVTLEDTDSGLENTARNERLFEALGGAGQLLLGSSSCLAAASAALGRVAAAMPGSRLALLEVPPAVRDWPKTRCVAEAPQQSSRDPIPRAEFVEANLEPRGAVHLRRWCRRLFEGQTIQVVSSSPEARFLAPLGATAALAMPLHTGRPGIHVLLITSADERPVWSTTERGVLESLGSMFASALRRDLHLQELERSERRFRQFIEDMPSGVALFRNDGTVALCNSSLLRLLELDPHQTLTSGPLLEAVDEYGERFDFAKKILQPVFEEGVQVRGALCCIHTQLTRTPVWLMLSADPILGTDCVVDNALVAVTEVTARRQAESQLKASLQEKELLVQEVFHRVKNNLQTISTLLRMQARASPSPEIARAIESAHARVLAMALVHEQLYAEGLQHAVDLCKTVRRISQAALNLAKEEGCSIDVVVEGNQVTTGITESMLLGLIFNELLTNARRHAFSPGQRGTIRTLLAREKDRVVLQVADDGRGLPQGTDPTALPGLGLRIVRLLVQQLHGTLSFAPAPGCCVTIEAPLQS